MTLWQPGMIMTASRMQDATPWVPLTTLGTYQTSGSTTASDGSPLPMARDLYVRDEVIRQFKGVINLANVTTAGYTFFTFYDAYKPDYERNWAAAGGGVNPPFRLFLSTAGNWGITAQTDGLNALRLDDFEIMSAPGRLPT